VFELGGNQQVMPLLDDTWTPDNPNSAFEYFPDASFATFDPFVNLRTEYRQVFVEPSAAPADLSYLQALTNGDPEAVMDAIIALDDQFKAGELPESAYHQRRAALKAHLNELL